jgi:hypothetical protein
MLPIFEANTFAVTHCQGANIGAILDGHTPELICRLVCHGDQSGFTVGDDHCLRQLVDDRDQPGVC